MTLRRLLFRICTCNSSDARYISNTLAYAKSSLRNNVSRIRPSGIPNSTRSVSISYVVMLAMSQWSANCRSAATYLSSYSPAYCCHLQKRCRSNGTFRLGRQHDSNFASTCFIISASVGDSNGTSRKHAWSDGQ